MESICLTMRATICDKHGRNLKCHYCVCVCGGGIRGVVKIYVFIHPHSKMLMVTQEMDFVYKESYLNHYLDNTVNGK